MTKQKKFDVPGSGKVSSLLEIPAGATQLLVLAHGAGAGMEHPGMTALAEALHASGVATFRYQFPYMEKGSKRPDNPKVAVATVAAAVRAAVKSAPELEVFAGGRSFGGRMTTTASSLGEIEMVLGIVCFGFPLHPAKQPDNKRAAHLEKVGHPMLFLQGTRDALADLELLGPVLSPLQEAGLATLHVVEGADHGFDVLKRSGRTGDEVLEELAGTAAAWMRERVD